MAFGIARARLLSSVFVYFYCELWLCCVDYCFTFCDARLFCKRDKWEETVVSGEI